MWNRSLASEWYYRALRSRPARLVPSARCVIDGKTPASGRNRSNEPATLRPPTRPGEPTPLARSRHASLREQLVAPSDDHDPERAAALCAEVCRADLLDLAPALILLPSPERARAQAVTAWARTLFDFVRQSGLEGERLAQVNRWEFELENALSGEPAGQPIFVRLAQLHAERAFDPAAFDLPLAVARRRIAVRRPPTESAAAAEAEQLARAALAAIEAPDRGPLLDLGAGVLRLRRLLALGEDRRRNLESLPADELADPWTGGRPPTEDELASAVQAETRRLGALLTADGPRSAPRPLRPAARFLRRAARYLNSVAAARGGAIVEHPPTLPLGRRLLYLLLSKVA